ncbi:thiamine phosphate synthase [Agromyces bauzanensis]
MNTRRSLDVSLTLVADPAVRGPRGLEAAVAEAVAGGVRTVLLRDATSDSAALLRRLGALAAAIDGRATLIVYDHVDVALAARARGIRVGGVHLERGADAASEARVLLGDDAVIGLSASRPAHVARLRRMPRRDVDYLGVGPIRAASTRLRLTPALGVDGFARFAAEAELPCVAIGGITVADVQPLRDAGAAGIALDAAVCAAPDPRAAAEAFAAQWLAR